MREGRIAAGLVAGALATLASALVLARRVRVQQAKEALPGRGASDEKAAEGRAGRSGGGES